MPRLDESWAKYRARLIEEICLDLHEAIRFADNYRRIKHAEENARELRRVELLISLAVEGEEQ